MDEQNQFNEQNGERTAEQILADNGYDAEDIVLLKDESYDSALIAVTDDYRAVYSYDKMVEWYTRMKIQLKSSTEKFPA